MTLTIQRPSIPVPLTLARGGTEATTAAGARDKLELGDLATLDAPGGTTTFLRADATWAVPPGGSDYWTRTTPAAVPGEGLLAFWRFEEASGNRIDSVGGLALQPQGTVAQITNAAGRQGLSLKFNATAGTHLSLPHTAVMSAGPNQSFTFAFWYYLDAALINESGFVGKGGGGAQYTVEYEVYYNGGNLYLRMGNGISTFVQTIHTAPAGTGAWHLVVAWFDQAAQLQALQVDNGTPVTTANTVGSYTSSLDLEVGRQAQYAAGPTLNGRLDCLMWWKRVLTTAERTALWNSGTGLDYPLPTSVLTPTTPSDLLQVRALDLTDPLTITEGGTGATDAAGARTALGLGTMAQQDAGAVAITGGTAILSTLSTTGNVGLGVAPGSNRLDVVGIARAYAFVVNQDQDFAAFSTNLNAGGSRMAFAAYGTALSQFGGSVGIKLPPSSHTLEIGFPKTTGAYGISVKQTDGDTGGGNPLLFVNAGGSVIGSISTTASATAFNTSSDVRLKHSIAPLTAALATILACKPVRFRWNADDSPGVDFLAHELQGPVPDAVTGLPDEVHPDGSIKPQQVDKSRLIPYLTGAIKELAAQVEALQARVATLEAALA